MKCSIVWGVWDSEPFQPHRVCDPRFTHPTDGKGGSAFLSLAKPTEDTLVINSYNIFPCPGLRKKKNYNQKMGFRWVSYGKALDFCVWIGHFQRKLIHSFSWSAHSFKPERRPRAASMRCSVCACRQRKTEGLVPRRFPLRTNVSYFLYDVENKKVKEILRP